VLVMVAPPVKTRTALEYTDEEYQSIVAQELLGPMACIREAARRMVTRKSGRIISFSSMSGKTGMHKHVAPYAAAKGGLITFSRALAADLAPTGVTVNVIATSLFDVQVAGQSPEKLAETLKGIPVGRVGRSEEAAHAVLFLASAKAGYVTGETMSLSGGRFMD
jgi:3-oxoacyl-[acyl-carrier protein] reductase